MFVELSVVRSRQSIVIYLFLISLKTQRGFRTCTVITPDRNQLKSTRNPEHSTRHKSRQRKQCHAEDNNIKQTIWLRPTLAAMHAQFSAVLNVFSLIELHIQEYCILA